MCILLHVLIVVRPIESTDEGESIIVHSTSLVLCEFASTSILRITEHTEAIAKLIIVRNHSDLTLAHLSLKV